nr:MAG: replication associated protein [Cressdnaviricota sp.]
MSQQLFRYSFTVHLRGFTPLEKEVQRGVLVEMLNDRAKKWEFQEEDTKENPHYQGWMVLKGKERIEPLGSWWAEGGMPMHLTPTKDQKATEAYCRKADTHVAGPWRNFELNEEYDGGDLWPKDKWPAWMAKLYANLQQVPQDRVIQWFYDKVGGHGKSKFIKYMDWKGEAACFGYMKANDMTHAVCKEEKTHRIYMWDLTKCKPREVAAADLYNALEMIKNGMVRSGKYDGQKKVMRPPHVVVFSNSMPDKNAVTAGRLLITDISNEPK